MKLGNGEDLYSFLFHGNSEVAAKAKDILQKLKKDCVPDDEFVKDFTEGETNVVLYKMKRHECHSLLYNLQETGLIKKEGELWCLDDKFLKVLERMIAQVAELRNLSAKIEYSKVQAR